MTEESTDKDPWVDIIREWLNANLHASVTLPHAAREALGLSEAAVTSRVSRRITEAFRVLGFEKHLERKDGIMRAIYTRKVTKLDAYSDFSAHPKSVNEHRINPTKGTYPLTPREALIDFLRGIDSGATPITALTIVAQTPGDDMLVASTFDTARDAVGAMEMAKIHMAMKGA